MRIRTAAVLRFLLLICATLWQRLIIARTSEDQPPAEDVTQDRWPTTTEIGTYRGFR